MTRTCSGTWSTNPVKCVGVSCGPAPQVSHASVTTTGQTYLETSTYTCDPGYSLLSSSSVLTCTANRTWSSEDMIICAPLVCDILTLPAFTEIAQDNNLGPDNIGDVFGYELSTESPTGSPIPETPDGVYQQGDEVSTKCVDGYIMFTTPINKTTIVSTRLRCLEGNWTTAGDQNIICLPTFCSNFSVLPNMAVVEVVNEPVVKAKYRCLSGYGLESLAPVGTEKVVTEFFAYCTENLGWEIPPGVQAGCVPIGCGPILLPLGSGLQTSTDYSSIPGSKVTISCQPALYQKITDSPASQRVIECLGDGNWSLSNENVTCAPCNQSENAAGIPNSVLKVNPHSAEKGYTAEVSCASDFLMPGISRFVRCGFVNGSPTWMGVENITRCLQTRWVNPDSTDNIVKVPVYLDLMETGVEGCTTIKKVKEDVIRLEFGQVYFAHKLNHFAAKFRFKTDSNGFASLKFAYSMASGDSNDDYIIPLPEQDSISVGEVCTICNKLNVTFMSYQVSKNGKILTEVAAKYYKEIIYFSVGFNVEVFEVDINYF
ncbi:hypothetical protein EGW08_017310 [Elysia chlorotica]|uniref:Sushi domain-containing protein n=1 Tax=Elysia chlorotica TaxID=188477 RepID=A0A3S0ZHD5_ELYCH|nr:hypothetical protein EGW08_017310 [Elysia chlorotica]